MADPNSAAGRLMVLLAVLLTFAAIHSARASPSGNRKESVASVTASSGRAQGVFTNPAYAVHHDTVANAEAFVADGAGNSWETAGGAATEAKHVADAVGKNLRRLLRLTNHAAVVRSYRNMMDGVGKDGVTRPLSKPISRAAGGRRA